MEIVMKSFLYAVLTTLAVAFGSVANANPVLWINYEDIAKCMSDSALQCVVMSRGDKSLRLVFPVGTKMEILTTSHHSSYPGAMVLVTQQNQGISRMLGSTSLNGQVSWVTCRSADRRRCVRVPESMGAMVIFPPDTNIQVVTMFEGLVPTVLLVATD